MTEEIKPPTLSEMETSLTHYGVRGMRWGVRKEEQYAPKHRLDRDNTPLTNYPEGHRYYGKTRNEIKQEFRNELKKEWGLVSKEEARRDRAQYLIDMDLKYGKITLEEARRFESILNSD